MSDIEITASDGQTIAAFRDWIGGGIRQITRQAVFGGVSKRERRGKGHWPTRQADRII
ncbi:hypothetical protein HNS03_13730 [Amorphus sp. 3PC139-8]